MPKKSPWKESKNTAQSSESSPPLKCKKLTSDKRKTTLWKSKLTEDQSLTKLNSPPDCSKRKSISQASSNTLKWSMLSESPRVTESKVSSRDSDANIYKRKPTEVTEELVVSDHGIQPELDSPSPEPVNMVTTTELKWTRRSTESESPMIRETHQLRLIWPIKPSLHWEDSHTTDPSETISLWLRDAVLDQRRESLFWERAWLLDRIELPWSRSNLNSSILPVRWDTVDSKLMKKKLNIMAEILKPDSCDFYLIIINTFFLHI